ncbi:AtpZ/AtpI family protein [Chloroflexota bacterium]
MLLMVENGEAGMPRWVAALRLLGVGFFIGGCIVGGIVAGLWLDDRLSTKPVFMIAGLVAGVVVAFYGVYQMLLPLLNSKRDKEDN